MGAFPYDTQGGYADDRIVLFHVTTRYRVDQILARGVDPSKSRGKKQVSWWVRVPMLEWAIAHCSDRHGTPIRNLRVIARVLPFDNGLIPEYIKPTRWRFVYTCDTIYHPSPLSIMTARQALKTCLCSGHFYVSPRDGTIRTSRGV